MKLKHRDSQKRFYIEGLTYFCTTNTKQRTPFFAERIFCDLFVENMRLCKQLKQFKLYGWVLCLDHFHWMIEPGPKFSYSRIMQFMKTHISRNINIIMGFSKYHYERAIGQSRLHNDHILNFDKFIIGLKSRFQIKYLNNDPFPKFQWHKSFHDHYIRLHNNDFENHMQYMYNNLFKHDLPDGWPYVYTNPKYEDLIDKYSI